MAPNKAPTTTPTVVANESSTPQRNAEDSGRDAAGASEQAAEVQAPPATPPQETVSEVAQAPRVEFDELTVPADAVMGIRFDTSLSSDTARVEDRVTARLVRDVTVDGHTAVRAGSKLEGNVAIVQRGGKFRDRARIGVRFNTLVLADNTRTPIQTELIFRDGDAPGGEATAKVGGAAVVGTILGSVFGGKKGAAIGSAAGAAGGAAAVAAGSRNAAVIPGDTPMTVRLAAPLTVLIPRDSAASR